MLLLIKQLYVEGRLPERCPCHGFARAAWTRYSCVFAAVWRGIHTEPRPAQAARAE